MEDFPIEPTPREDDHVEAYLDRNYPENVRDARAAKAAIKDRIGNKTGMSGPGKRDLFGELVSSDRMLFDVITRQQVKAVLVVSLRFHWKPENVLALWQTEGLPSPSVRPFEKPSPGRFQDVSRWYEGKVPKDEEEARSWARSAVLWERWGMDRLTPIIVIPGEDNKLRTNARKTVHDQAFREGRERECGTYLKGDPLPYLNRQGRPIELRRAGRKWSFRTHSEYQTTMLTVQYARFLNQVNRIPPGYQFDTATVYTRSVAPAFLYMHYNSRFAEEHLKKIARRLVRVCRPEKKAYDGTDLHRFFVSNPIPKEIRDYVDNKKQLNSHSYVNALRFEFIRNIYEIAFRDFLPEILPSPYLVEEL